MPTSNPIWIRNDFMNHLETGLWKEHKAEAKTEAASARSQHLPPCAECVTKTRPLLKKDTVHQITRAKGSTLQTTGLKEGESINT